MSLKIWRKIHLYSFGYLKSVSLFISVIMFFIFLTGILLAHRHGLNSLNRVQVPLLLLPSSYTERVAQLNKVQEGIPGGQLQGAPLSWVIRDLHTGDFFGPWGIWFYDVISVSLMVLAVSGVYLYLKRPGPGKRRANRRRPGR